MTDPLGFCASDGVAPLPDTSVIWHMDGLGTHKRCDDDSVGDPLGFCASDGVAPLPDTSVIRMGWVPTKGCDDTSSAKVC